MSSLAGLVTWSLEFTPLSAILLLSYIGLTHALRPGCVFVFAVAI